MLYYRLTNFFQNHRLYVKSVEEGQLMGQNLTAAELTNSGNCEPLILAPNGKPYYPCGLIANSLFNGNNPARASPLLWLIEDTFTQPLLLNVDDPSASNETYNMTIQDIAWLSGATRFGKTTYTNDQVEPPPGWALEYPNGYTDENPIPNLATFPEFQVWMRTAGLPSFSKLALRNAEETMKAGTYQIDIAMSNFPSHLIYCAVS